MGIGTMRCVAAIAALAAVSSGCRRQSVKSRADDDDDGDDVKAAAEVGRVVPSGAYAQGTATDGFRY